MGRVYVETRNGLIVSEALTATARILVSAGGGEVTFTADEMGPHFVVDDAQMDAVLAHIGSEPAAPKKRRGRKKAEPEAVEPETPEADSEDSEDPDIQE